MDLRRGWEKKALMLLVLLVILIITYSFISTPSQQNVTQNNSSSPPASVVNMPFDQSTGNTTTTFSNANSTGSVQLTAEQAKNIAAQANTGYESSDATLETLVINSETLKVWKVTLTKTGSTSKTVYIDQSSGRIVK